MVSSLYGCRVLIWVLPRFICCVCIIVWSLLTWLFNVKNWYWLKYFPYFHHSMFLCVSCSFFSNCKSILWEWNFQCHVIYNTLLTNQIQWIVLCGWRYKCPIESNIQHLVRTHLIDRASNPICNFNFCIWIMILGHLHTFWHSIGDHNHDILDGIHKIIKLLRKIDV